MADQSQSNRRISIHSLRVEGDKCNSIRFVGGSISIHSLRVEGDSSCRSCPVCHCISIHSLRVEGDYTCLTQITHFKNFNPLPPCGGRPAVPRQANVLSDFNPLPPCGGRLWSADLITPINVFQSTPSVWRETAALCEDHVTLFISIHSLRVEGDQSGHRPCAP